MFVICDKRNIINDFFLGDMIYYKTLTKLNIHFGNAYINLSKVGHSITKIEK